MKRVVHIPSLVWLLMSYAILTSAFLWAGRQTGGSLAGWVFMGCLALSWLPLYVFLNRAEILGEKAFWFSHAAAALVAVGAYAAMASWMESEPVVTPKRADNWPTLLLGIACYLLVQQSWLNILKGLAQKTQERVEKALRQAEKPGHK